MSGLECATQASVVKLDFLLVIATIVIVIIITFIIFVVITTNISFIIAEDTSCRYNLLEEEARALANQR
jgi:hypothetical protein